MNDNKWQILSKKDHKLKKQNKLQQKRLQMYPGKKECYCKSNFT